MTKRPRSESGLEPELAKVEPSKGQELVEGGSIEVQEETKEEVLPTAPVHELSTEEEPIVPEQLAVTGWEDDTSLEDHPFWLLLETLGYTRW